MRDPFVNYDSWLERPYQDMIEASDRYYEWCELHGIDPDDEDSVTAYDAWTEDVMDYELEYDYDVDNDY